MLESIIFNSYNTIINHLNINIEKAGSNVRDELLLFESELLERVNKCNLNISQICKIFTNLNPHNYTYSIGQLIVAKFNIEIKDSKIFISKEFLI